MRLRSILIASGVAVAVLAAGGWALISAGGSSGSAQAAQSAQAPTVTPQADPPRATPTRASRGETRDPSPSPVPKTVKPKPKKTKPSYRVLSSGSCEASFYGEGQMTASGETFDPSELTAAHKTLPMGSKVRVTNKNNDRSVIVRINDRGPYAGGRCLDLSTAAMEKVGGTGSGVIPVRYQVLSRG
ncbi:septal ring lytic transglycosylase RlpA family protein [Actinomadura barringtoniae]|uniref:Probable endolytic peptidoglycan transglycosylase RlpA n=1 Tax=Actinomadura barringtoniae TaxID=1427535 RepID=A0A939PPL7_9ACTN|nr:septal ring lytic transglycosylase RlpA family protein [Actinomadura barringtoniae]MBO2452884.1 septal ring lytic transglycosylase RlpA family protein [Actinomadura barringtoniae]